MGNIVAFTVEFHDYPIECANCAVPIILPQCLYDARRKDHGSFYCPNGHSNYWPQENEAEKLRKQLAQKERELAFERERAAANYAAREKAERANRKLKKRISGGACPCCNRSFTNLHRHMTTRHPDFATIEE